MKILWSGSKERRFDKEYILLPPILYLALNVTVNRPKIKLFFWNFESINTYMMYEFRSIIKLFIEFTKKNFKSFYLEIWMIGTVYNELNFIIQLKVFKISLRIYLSYRWKWVVSVLWKLNNCSLFAWLFVLVFCCQVINDMPSNI